MIGSGFMVIPLALMLTAEVSSLSLEPPRIALVTGANKGIGKEIARKLVNDANVTTVLACRTGGEEAAAELGCKHVYLDLTNDKSIHKAREYIEQEFGRLDILINNAAICFNDPTLFGRVPYTPFEKQAEITIRTNYFGTYQVTKEMLPLLEASSSPRIVNIASYAGRLSILKSRALMDAFTAPNLTEMEIQGYMNDFVKAVETGVHAQQGWPNTCYGMSKLGVIALTRVLSRDFPGIMVNSVDPGYCATDQNNHQGTQPAERGAVTPFLLATLDESKTDLVTGKHWMDEHEISW
jgi:carbonyl reductase 1